MGLKLLQTLAKPLHLRSRQDVEHYDIRINDFFKQNDGFLISFRVKSQSSQNNKYQCQIWLNEKTFTTNTLVKFNCDCPSFQYQFETILSQYGALINPPRSDKLPKKIKSLYVCKHLEGAIRKIIPYKNLEYLIREYKIEI